MNSCDDDFYSAERILQHHGLFGEYLSTGNTRCPVTVELDLTNACNNKCPKCPGHRPDNAYIARAFVFNIIDQLHAVGVKGIVLSGGGEPIIHRDFIDIAKHIKSSRIDAGLVTSGQRPFPGEQMEDLVKSLVWLRISLDAGSPEVYKITHGLDRNKYEAALDFTRKAVLAREKTNSQCKIGVGYLTGWGFDGEIEDYERAAVLCAEMGVDYFQIRPLTLSNKVYDFSPELTKRIAHTSEMRLFKSRHKYDLFDADKSRNRRTYGYCHISHFTTNICVDGGVYVCCELRNRPAACLGSLHEKSFVEIWKSVRDLTSLVDLDQCVPQCKNDKINRFIDSVIRNKNNSDNNFI